MNISFIPLAILVFCASIISGCNSQKATTPASTSSTNSPTLFTGQIQQGGTLRRLSIEFPKVLGYPQEFSPLDAIFASLILEKLVGWDEKGNLIPELAESWEGDPDNKTITWRLRKGIKFTDETDFNAEALKWNYESRLRSGDLVDGKSIVSLEILDDYTLRMHLMDYHRMMFLNYGWTVMISPTAFEEAGGGDMEKSKEWARLNAVGTGPFKIVDYQRDVVLRYERNNNYWRKNKPYLAGIESRLIPDFMISSAMMQAKEADMLVRADVHTALDLEERGFKVNWGPGLLMALLPNSSDPNSPYAKKKVREAIEYAIDRPTLAKMIGYGKYEPLTQMTGSTFLGYVPDYNPRPYNKNKAKQLLAEAGYPRGFKTKIISQERNRDLAAALQGYLGEVGIEVDLDIADTARYLASVFSDGWSDLALSMSGINPDATDLFIHFGPNPTTYQTGNIAKSPEYLALCDEALHTYDDAKYKHLLQQMVKQAGDDAMIVPLYNTITAVVMQPYVHSDYPMLHTIVWNSYEEWMDKH